MELSRVQAVDLSRSIGLAKNPAQNLHAIFSRYMSCLSFQKNPQVVDSKEKDPILSEEVLEKSMTSLRELVPHFSDPKDLLKLSLLKKKEEEFFVDQGHLDAFFGYRPPQTPEEFFSATSYLGRLFQEFGNPFSEKTEESFQRAQLFSDRVALMAEDVRKSSYDDQKVFLDATAGTLCRALADSRDDPFMYFGDLSANKNRIPPFVHDLLKEQLPPEAYQFLEADAGDFTQKLKDSIARFLEKEGLTLPESVDLPEEVSSAVEKLLQSKSFLQKMMGQSFYGRFEESVKEDIREILVGPRSADQREKTFAEDLWDRALEKGLKTAITDVCLETFEKGKQYVDGQVKDAYGAIGQLIPKTLRQCLSAGGLTAMDANQFWIEFRKQDTGKYTVYFFSQDVTGEIHEALEKGGKTGSHLPVVFTDVEPSELNKEFFRRFITYQAGPKGKDGVDYCIRDVFIELQALLKKQPNSPKEETCFPDSVALGDSSVDFLKVYLYHHMELKEGGVSREEQFRRMINYDLPLQTLINFWPQVQKKPEILEQYDTQRALHTILEQLSREGLALYEKKEISLDELKSLYGTIWEVRNALKTQQKEEKTFAPSTIVSGQMKGFLYKLLADSQISPLHIDALKDAFVSVVGDDCGDAFDMVMQDILPELASEQSSGQSREITWSEVLQVDGMKRYLAELRSMRCSILHISRAIMRAMNTVAYILNHNVGAMIIQTCITIFFPHVHLGFVSANCIAWLLGQSGPLALKKILPKEVYEFFTSMFGLYSTVMNAINKQIRYFVLRCCLQAVLTKEGIATLNREAKALQSQCSRSGEIRWNITEQTTDTKEQVRIAKAAKVFEEKASRKRGSDALSSLDVGVHLPRPRGGDLITPESTQGQLQSWKEMSDSFLGTDNFKQGEAFLNRQIRSLPIPGEKGSEIWQQHAAPEELIEDLYAVLQNLSQFYVQKEDKQSADEYMETFTSMYTIYAIVDSLFKRCETAKYMPESMQPNARALGEKMGSPLLRFAYPDTFTRFQEVSKYFGFDPSKKYSVDELNAYERKSLLHFQSRSLFGGDRICESGGVSFSRMSEWHVSSSSSCYITLQEDPEVRKKLAVYGVDAAVSKQEIFFLLFEDPTFEQAEVVIDDNLQENPTYYKEMRVLKPDAQEAIDDERKRLLYSKLLDVQMAFCTTEPSEEEMQELAQRKRQCEEDADRYFPDFGAFIAEFDKNPPQELLDFIQQTHAREDDWTKELDWTEEGKRVKDEKIRRSREVKEVLGDSKRRQGILPRPFYCLRHIDMMTKQIGQHEWHESVDSEKYERDFKWFYHKPRKGGVVQEFLRNQTSRYFQERYWTNPLVREQANPLSLPWASADSSARDKKESDSIGAFAKTMHGYDFGLMSKEEKRLREPEQDTQSAIMHKRLSKDKDLSLEEQKLLHMINQNPKDQVVRCLGFFDAQSRDLLRKDRFRCLFNLLANNKVALDAQLKTRPDFAKDLGRYFKESLDHFSRKRDWSTCLFLVQMGSEMMDYAKVHKPDADRYFPDFGAFIAEDVIPYYQGLARQDRQLDQFKDGVVAALCCFASSCLTLDFDTVEPDKRRNIMKMLARLRYTQSYPDWHESSKKDIIYRSKEVLYKWGPHIKDCMKEDEDFRNEVLDDLMKDMGVQPESGNWEGEGDYSYFVKGHLSVDLDFVFDRDKEEGAHSVEELIDHLKKTTGISLTEDFIGDASRIHFSRSQITLERQGRNIQIYREWEGKRYRLLTKQDFPDASLGKVQLKENHCIWIKDQDTETPSLLVMHKHDVLDKFLLKKQPVDDRRVMQEYEIQSHWKNIGGEFYQRKSLTSYKHEMQLLSWFQPAADTLVYTDRDDRNSLKMIAFPKTDLAFDMREVEGEKRAYDASKKTPGFYIAKKQKDPSLMQYANYLLLENDQGEKKVHLVGQSTKELLGICFLKNLGRIATSPFMESMMQNALSQTTSKQPIYTFSINEKGELESEDPEALVYLSFFHFCHGNIAKSLEYCDKLQAWGRCYTFPPSVFSFLNQFLLPLFIMQTPEAEKMLLQIIAVQEKNVLIQQKQDTTTDELAESEKDQAFQHVRLLATQIKYYQYLERVEQGGFAYLSPYEELFILRTISQQNLKIMKKQFADDSKWKDSFSSIAEHLMMIPKIAKRYQYLRQQYEKHRGWGEFAEEIFLEGFLGESTAHVDVVGGIQRLMRSGSFKHKKNTLTKMLMIFKEISESQSSSSREPEIRDLQKYFKDHMDKTVVEGVSTSLSDLTPAYIKENFWMFYRLAAKALPKEWESCREKKTWFAERADELSKNLSIMKGQKSYTHTVIFDILCLVKDHPKRFMSPNQIMELLEKDKEYEEIKSEYEDRVRYRQRILSELNDCRRAIDKKVKLFRRLTREEIENLDRLRENKEYHEIQERLRAVEEKLESLKSEKWKKSSIQELLSKPLQVFSRQPVEKYVPRDVLDCYVNDLVEEVSSATAQSKKGLSAVVGAFGKDIATATAESTARNAAYWASGLAALRGTEYAVNTALRVGQTAYRMGVQRQAAEQERVQAHEEVVLDTESRPPEALLELMQKRESLITEAMHKVFDRHFSGEEKEEAESHRVAPYRAKESDEKSVKEGFDRLNKSLDDFYAREKEKETEYRLKEKDAKKALKEDLLQLRREVYAELDAERQYIEAYANTNFLEMESEEQAILVRLSKKSAQRPLSFQEIDDLFIQSKEKELMSRSQMKEKEIAHLNEKMYLFHVMASRCNLLFERVDSLSDDASEKDLGLVAKELQRERVYKFDNVPDRLLRGKLVFESRTKRMLWSKQSSQIDRLLLGKFFRSVVELIMGSGKTWYGIPLSDAYSADGDSVVVNIWPSPVANTNISTIGRQAKSIFSQAANAISFSRAIERTKEKLWGIKRFFEGSRFHREQMNMTKESMQALELCFIEDMLDAGEFEGTSFTKYTKERLDSFRDILKLVREKGVGFIDEFHVASSRRKELNHPLGRAKAVKKRYVKVISELLFELVHSPEFEHVLTVKSKKPEPLSEEKFKDKILVKLAQKMAAYEGLDIEEPDRSHFVQYVTGSWSRVPDFVKRHPKRSQIALVKGLLTILVPGALEKTIHVDFNPSKKGDGEYARPSEGNDNPLEEATIRNPFEALVKTGLVLAHDRLKKEQLDKLLAFMQKEAREEIRQKRCLLEETKMGKLFGKECFGFNLLVVRESDRENLYKAMNRSDRLIFLYLQEIVADQILYFSENLSSNSSNFNSMFSRIRGDTGTPFNAGSYPVGTEVLSDAGTDGESIDLMELPGKSQISVLEKNAPLDVLDEVVGFFKKNPKVRAFIDRGAVFNGVPNDKVAKKLLEYAVKERPEIQGVAFYLNKELVILERGADKPIPIHLSRIPVHKRFSYFPQPQTYAADIPQIPDAVGVVSIGEDIHFNELAQAIWRMRGLKRGEQTLHFVMTEKVKRAISEGREPTVSDIIAFARRNEDKMLAEDNYLADKQKMYNVVRRAVLDKILQVSSLETAHQILIKFKDLFVSSIEEDPFLVFGAIDMKESPEIVLSQLRKKLNKMVQERALFSCQEKRVIEQELKAIGGGSYPDRVHVYSWDDGRDLDDSRLDDLGQATQIDADSSQDVDRDQDMDVDQDLDQNLDTQPAVASIHEKPQKFFFWPAGLNPTDLKSWLCIQQASKEDVFDVAMSFLRRATDAVASFELPIFRLKDALSTSSREEVWKMASNLSPNILATNNMMHLVTKGTDAKDPFSLTQVPILEVLVIQESPTSPVQIMLIDQQEADYWRKKLQEDRECKHKTNLQVKIGLYDISSEALVAEGLTPFDNELSLPDFQSLVTQVKFLRGDKQFGSHRQTLKSWMARGSLGSFKSYTSYIDKHHSRRELEGSHLESAIFAIERKRALEKEAQRRMIVGSRYNPPTEDRPFTAEYDKRSLEERVRRAMIQGVLGITL